jgi:hypothetical protein
MVAQEIGSGQAVTAGEPASLSAGGLPAAAVDFSGTENDTSRRWPGGWSPSWAMDVRAW